VVLRLWGGGAAYEDESRLEGMALVVGIVAISCGWGVRVGVEVMIGLIELGKAYILVYCRQQCGCLGEGVFLFAFV
jgi:predicted aconitase with swiveling domain